MYFTYFAKSLKNNKIYSGFTAKTPLERVHEHNMGVNKFTKYNKPFKLIYYEEYLCKEDALKREKFYKTGLGKQIKQAIVKYMETNKLGP